MARNTEIVRQWNLLRAIEGARFGLTMEAMIRLSGVTRRTVYRDLDALQEARFPLTNETRDGRVYWMLGAPPFKPGTQPGFSLSELCALYLSRRMVEVLTGVTFQAPLQAVFGRFEQDLPPRMRQYLDQLPSALAAMPAEGTVRRSAEYDRHVEQLLQAALNHREVEMVYHSNLHKRTRSYTVHPYRIVYARGGMYMFAFVPEYDQIRTFAMQRVRKMKLLDSHFTPTHTLPENPFEGSLGPNLGHPTTHVVLRFDGTLAPLIRERVHHPSQKLTMLPDGSLRMDLDVCNDWWLHNWILGHGHLVTVEAPPELVEQIVNELDQARHHYARVALDEGPVSAAMLDFSLQGGLPFGEGSGPAT
jgi:predicted DNA-binding transcriptional regulator YafY